MKSSNTSFSTKRRALLAAAVVLATGNLAVLAQSSGGGTGSSGSGSSGSGSSSSNYGSSTSSPNDPSSTSGSSGMSSSSGMSGSSDMSSSQSSGSSSDKLSWGDRRFVTKAADSGQEEVQLAQLATQKASSPDVKQFAQEMVDQHSQVNSQLMSLANSKNVKIDQDDTTKDRTYKRMSKASGSDFDREFVSHMVDQHEKDIKLYEKAANDAKDPQVKQFASNTLDHLRMHLQQVQQLQASIVPTGRSGSDSWRSSGSSGSSGSSSSGMSGSSDSSGSGMSGSSGSSGSGMGSSGSSGSGSSGSGSSGYGSSGSGASSGGSGTSSPTTR